MRLPDRRAADPEVLEAGLGRLGGEIIGIGEARKEAEPDHPLGGSRRVLRVQCTAVEAEVDEETGDITIHRHVTVSDVGQGHQPAAGADAGRGRGDQGLGHTLMEHYIFDDAGRIRNLGAIDYRIPTSMDLPLQHFMLVDNFTVLENVVLGAQGGRLIGPALAKAREELTRLARDYELDVDPDAIVGELPVGLQQRVEILKALFKGAETLILDEPTGVLTPDEADHLFRILGQLRDQGKTVILITHKLREIMAITDHVSVMRRGEMVATKETKRTSVEELAELMVGRRVLLRVEKGKAKPREVVLEVNNLTGDRKGTPRVDDVSFNVRSGEIVGIAGVSGNGQSELLDLIAGITKPASGEIIFEGKSIGMLGDPQHLRKEGLAHVPEDRQHRGLIATFDASESVSGAGTMTRRWARVSGWIAKRW